MNLFRARLLPLLLLLLTFACGGGGGQTSYPGAAPLVLSVDEPAEGMVIDGAAPALRGRVSEPDAFVACQGRPVPVDAQGRFQAALQLQPGLTRVVVQAWHAADARQGRGTGLLPPLERVAATVVRNLVFPGNPLGFTISQPAEGARFTASPIAFAGTVSDPSAAVTLDGRSIPVAESGHFQGAADLQPGANVLRFCAFASGDRGAAVTRTVTYEPPPPPQPGALRVSLLEPPEGLLTSASTVAVTGTVSDPGASLSVNGQPVAPRADGAWETTLAPPEGPVTLTVRATKGAAVAQDQRRITVDRTPPAITLARPVPARVTRRTLDLQGRVDDPAAMLTLQGQRLALDAAGAFSSQYGLAEGPNTLRFRAVDAAGNVGVLEARTILDSTAPVVKLQSPEAGSVSSQREVTVRGTVDDPSARLVVGDRQVTPGPDGRFELQLRPPREGVQYLIALATDAAGNTGEDTRVFTLDWTPPVLAWADPTPEEGALVAQAALPVAAYVSEPATVALNGRVLSLQAAPAARAAAAQDAPQDPAGPYAVRTELALAEGHAVLALTATDRAGNTSRLGRRLQVGLTAPALQVTQPALDDKQAFTTREDRLTLAGTVTAPAFVEPLTLTANGSPVALDAAHGFSLPLVLAEGDNPVRLEARNRFGQTRRLQVLIRRHATPFDLVLSWPPEGLVLSDASTEVRGQVFREAASVAVNGAPVTPDAQGQFRTTLPLEAGANLIRATAVDAVGNQAAAQVRVTRVAPRSAGFHWDLPAPGAHSRIRTVAVSGQADLPGIASVSVDGVPMRLSGQGADGRFEGEVPLTTRGRTTLTLQARTLAGELLVERRDVVFQPELPLIRLLAPDAARPGATVPVHVLPEPGTELVAADITFNGRLLARVTAPFGPRQATVPADAPVGSRIPVEAVGTDAEGETITARTTLTVYDAGALLQQVLDDRTGLPLPGATVALEGGEGVPTDASGRAALATALPTSWLRSERPGYSPVWRSAALKQAGAEAVLDARLTPLDPPRAGHAPFAKGALLLQGATVPVSATPLSAQGLPGLLPPGWSPVSAWWIAAETPLTATLRLDPALPADARYAWARWDEAQHLWLTLAVPAGEPAGLPVPRSGGYVLLLPDPEPTAPPATAGGQPVPAAPGDPWRSGFSFSTGKGPNVMSTADAINGARADARLAIAFDGQPPVPSGALLRAELSQSYTLTEQRVIEPDTFSQDLLAHRWALTVADGAPALQGAGDGLLLRHPVRMSRTFQPSELVQGRLAVGFYHGGVRVADTGSGLVDASGGSVTVGGVTVTLPAEAVTGAALVRILPDAGDLAALWPELAGKGEVRQSCRIDVVGSLSKGFELSLDGLDLPSDARPLLLQRRVVQGRRLTLAVGELRKTGAWSLRLPAGAPPVREGGDFAVLLPSAAWDWIGGTATLPAGALARRLRAQAGNPAPSGAVAVADAVVDAGLVPARSGEDGGFAVPALVPADGALLELRGSRWDLGLTGSARAAVPSAGNELHLAAVPFAVTQILPAEGEAVPPAAVLQLLATAPIDPSGFQGVRLWQDGPAPVELALRRSLSQDGRTLLLVPERPLAQGGGFLLKVEALRAASGETAPAQYRRFRCAPQAPAGDVDLARIRLDYPDDQFNLTVTVPAGSVPPWALVSVEATEMGACGQGVMPPAGDLAFPLKAALGERIRVTVQTRDGRSVSGTIGRYVAPDGRTTLGVDGGRVEGPGGLAVVVPEGALAKAVELRVAPCAQPPAPAEGALRPGEHLLGALELRSSEAVAFARPPVLELPAEAVPPGAATRAGAFGNGPVALFQKVTATLPDGTEDLSYVLADTAQLSPDGRVLRSLGGLRLPDPVAGTRLQDRPVRLAAAASMAWAAAIPRLGAIPWLLPAPAALAAGSGGFSAVYCALYLPDAGYEPQYAYHSGTVYRNWNGAGRCGGQASADCYGPLAQAEVHRYAGTADLEAARRGRLARGRLLTVADEHGRYLNVGGSDAGAIPGQTWIALFAVDPRTGETSIDPNAPSASDLGLPWTPGDHSLAITSKGGNPFDPTLTAPRIRARLVDEQGTARTLFRIGEKATLRLTVESGSQPVVRGRLSGDLEQDFGALPQDIPVQFAKEGPWSVGILGWTARPVEGRATCSVLVTPPGQLGPSLSGKPELRSRVPDAGDQGVEPAAHVEITFSEPVRGATALAFNLRADDAERRFSVVADGREVTDPATLVQQVWLVPAQRFPMGAKVTVGVTGLILDQDGQSLSPESWTFTVRGADDVGALADAAAFSQSVAYRGKLYMAEDTGPGYSFDADGYHADEGLRQQGIRIVDIADPSRPVREALFGQYRAWEPPTPEYQRLPMTKGPFNKSSITGLRVVTGVGIGGSLRDVLLVATRPWQDRELLMAGDPDLGVDDIARFRQNALWAFDITGDAESRETSMGRSVPRLLMGASQGTASPNWVKALGGAGGILGSLRLRGGLSLWDADQWKAGWDSDLATLSDWTIRYRTNGRNEGLYPTPASLVASNGFYSASDSAPSSVMSGVFAEDRLGRPVAYATMSYSKGLLACIDGKVGSPEALATFTAGGPLGMDARIHDLSFAVDHQYANLVEILKGSWQGPHGTEQDTLLLVGTLVENTGRLWVLQPDLTDPEHPGATPLALAELPARITRIVPDPGRMLVGVEVNGKGYILDLKNLVGNGPGPVTLAPIYTFDVQGTWTLSDGLLCAVESSPSGKKLVIKSLSDPVVRCEDPEWMDAEGYAHPGSGICVQGVQVELASLDGRTVLPRVGLDQCSWMLVSEGGGQPVPPGTPSLLEHPLRRMRLYLKPGTRPSGSVWLLRLWGTDAAGNPFEGLTDEEYLAGKPVSVRINQQEAVP